MSAHRATFSHCATCRKRRPLPKKFNYVSRAEWERDPFCSTACAREAVEVVQA